MTVEATVPDEATAAALDMLRETLQKFGETIVALDAVGMKPSDGLRAIGIDVPIYAAPMLDTALKVPPQGG